MANGDPEPSPSIRCKVPYLSFLPTLYEGHSSYASLVLALLLYQVSRRSSERRPAKVDDKLKLSLA